jgi:hypothetical protein
MATFEFDLAPGVPEGFDIIDGGNCRLSRTFFTPSAPRIDAHESWGVAIIEPAPPEEVLAGIIE